MPQRKNIRVLVVDDSIAVRHALKQLLEADPEIEVIATASDPYVAVEHISKEVPDVITLDIEMPRMDGLSFLKKMMTQHPIPVVVCSSLTTRGSEAALSALELGAVEVIGKPNLSSREALREAGIVICDAVKSAARCRPRTRAIAPVPVRPKLTADAIMPPPGPVAVSEITDKIIVIGASTGGTEALRDVLEQVPPQSPGIVIVQHMPEKFTASFAARLDNVCAIRVKEAADGDRIVPGHAYIAPGNRHALIKRVGRQYFVELRDGPLVSRHRPSVDVLFRSAARYGGKNVVGVIMTGMGDDGAKGMLEMRQTGAHTLAQDEASCVVFGMPGEAIKLGGAERVVPLPRIAHEMLKFGR